ncbi:peptide-methionine (S)-S-oxide reductase [Metamycoplasma arthritidis]|uniref:Peptide methionine sulfoxide reductase MsrA n=1 Tax=Metamycoplasma arthritidis (strain 158L3-1) TaxID=243272 RepID=MSRA_META1|nr:peptide-methionine (S)-S-oxide reductase MsrA [Metamycoplasma arthritidis]B3PND9.1 RecName: Full=Peptide methionine sulfoxide reductase MsrA; Short=Protein-methionine-S-oxide reductase; AltName: Full=Peptide-methionine (S)-S-oxide reductase; Short=Peptide Met(O) reductase [Metamycoplasma arthritidis 158L3-1]ACF07541.1 peptide methionine sulfoxide reductase A [Metamycoplasma arthritidis 158L3-1]VEU79049.1 peptide-methionine (S)-S-oxide reductase [Metamycoplasma arthritidis]
MKKIYVAGGCFWGVQGFLKTIKGIKKTTVGYANSLLENPTYELVKSHVTDAVETVEVIYDENILSLKDIVKKLFAVIDPTARNYQGPDHGRQYRNGFYFVDQEDGVMLRELMLEFSKKYEKPLATEILPLDNYYLAEDYHQDYFDKHPNAVCHIKF